MGLLSIEAEFNQDLPVGKARKWYPNGNLAFEAVYNTESNKCAVREWDDLGNIKQDQNKGDYFDQVTNQTTQLTASLGQVFQQVASLVPLVELVVSSNVKEAVHADMQKGMQEITKELAKLGEINQKLLFEAGLDPTNPEEAIWKSPSHRREVEKQVELMSNEMSLGMNQMQSALAKTVESLSKKIEQMHAQRQEAEAKEKPPKEETKETPDAPK